MVYLTSQLESNLAKRLSSQFLRSQHKLQREHDVGSVGHLIGHDDKQRH